jgi:hypothetical protein
MLCLVVWLFNVLHLVVLLFNVLCLVVLLFSVLRLVLLFNVLYLFIVRESRNRGRNKCPM